MRLESKNQVGKEEMRVQLKLFEACFMPALTYEIEAWRYIKMEEIMEAWRYIKMEEIMEI